MPKLRSNNDNLVNIINIIIIVHSNRDVLNNRLMKKIIIIITIYYVDYSC